MTVITISHQLGSGGRAIGQAVASELSLAYVDREIVREVARILHMREEIAALHDERVEGTVGLILRAFADGPALVFGALPLDPDLRIDEMTCQRTTRAVIEAAARSNLALIAGHGANFALAHHRGVLNVFLYAPLEQRVATIMAREQIDRAGAARMVQRSDQDRAHYVRRYYHADWQNPGHYHLMVNTAALPVAHVVDTIVAAWRGGAFGPFRYSAERND